MSIARRSLYRGSRSPAPRSTTAALAEADRAMSSKPPTVPQPPVAPRKPINRTLHGHGRTDDYAWLKDENWQQVMRDPTLLHADVHAYLEAENAYTKAVAAPFQALRETLFAEFRGRIKEDDSSVPAKDGVWEYYHRYREGGQHPVVCRRAPGDPESEQMLLDGDAEAEGEGLLPRRRLRPLQRPPALRLGRRHEGVGVLHALCEGPRDGPPARRHDRAMLGILRVGDGWTDPLLHRARREPPPLQDLPPSARRRSRG